MKSLLMLTMYASTVFAVAPLTADVLLIEQVRHVENMDVPVNGMTQSEVESRYGSPSIRHAAVGDPPIARWEYERWSAYFEYDRVLFTVLHKGEIPKNDPS